MGIKLSTVAIVALLYMATVFATCRKPRDCSQTNHVFELDARAYPDRDSIRVGDTVWIEINAPVMLTDALTLRYINYSGAANLGTNIGFQEIIGNTPQINNVTDEFSYKIEIGTEVNSSNPELFREYLFEERNGRFLFKLGLVPKRSGIFRINLGNAAGVYRADDKCSKASFTFNFKNTNQHFYLYPGGNSTPPGGATYYFKVR